MTIVYVLIALLVGWVIGFFDSNMRTAKKIQAAEAKAELAVKDAEKKIVAAQAQVKPDAPVTADNPGLLRLTNMNGLPSLEVDGAPLNIKTVSAEQKKRLIELLTFIRPWLESGQPLQPISKPNAPVNTTARPDPVQPAVSHSQPAPAVPSIKLTEEEKPLASLSMVGQIDAILQIRLANSPLAKRGIRLVESSIGGVEVYVGLNKYPAIDDVPDQEVKNFIRAAIAEWEKKFTPGM